MEKLKEPISIRIIPTQRRIHSDKKKKLWIYPTEIKNKKTNWKGQTLKFWGKEFIDSSTLRPQMI